MKTLHFHALVLEITDRCNARCAMCYQSAGPKGSDVRGDGNLPVEIAFRVIDEAACAPEIDSRLHISGGEAFIRYQDTMDMFRRGKSQGFLNIGTTTNAFWALNRDVALGRCKELADAGVTYLEVSMDYWHLPYVSLDRVRNLLWGARRVGLTIILRTLTTRNHHLTELFEGFDDLDFISVKISNGRVAPVGRGKSEIPPEEVYSLNTEGCCEDLLCLTVSPEGNVYPCCAGADMTTSLACGNVHRDTLAEAIFKMRTDRMIRQLVHAGSGSLIPIIKQLGFGDRLLEKHTSICHLCWDIFRDNELADALRAHFEEEQFQDMLHVLTHTQTSQT